ncbi:MAG TPA: 16S rRNA (uracil(1498)-N(3))-methyltransferase [Albitalea sp.]|nr:16S rRNA (uracil(1498)-N(3))-methyltransferase [Albitalea sp.]
MAARLYLPLPLHAGAEPVLPPGPSRHAQVLRLQPGDALTLFNGDGGEWSAQVLRIGRSEVQVRVGEHHAVERELGVQVTLAVGMPANERMDTLIEKATELGVATIQPLICERSVLRIAGERAQKKVEHWRGVAIAAAEQSGRTRVPEIAAVAGLVEWLREGAMPQQRFVLSLREGHAFDAVHAADAVCFLSGPEGGLSDAEESAARRAGFTPRSLGPRVLRADTAPLAVLAALALHDR